MANTNRMMPTPRGKPHAMNASTVNPDTMASLCPLLAEKDNLASLRGIIYHC
jgi:hypothetical protein